MTLSPPLFVYVKPDQNCPISAEYASCVPFPFFFLPLSERTALPGRFRSFLLVLRVIRHQFLELGGDKRAGPPIRPLLFTGMTHRLDKFLVSFFLKASFFFFKRMLNISNIVLKKRLEWSL